MERVHVFESIRSIINESGINDLVERMEADVAQGDDMGLFFTKPGPRGEVLWARDVCEEGAFFPSMPILSLPSLSQITHKLWDDDGATVLEILFELGGHGMVTHQIQFQYTAFGGGFLDNSSTFTIFSHATQRRSLVGEAASLMAALAVGPHHPDLQMAIESRFERFLPPMPVITEDEGKMLEMLERRLREDVKGGVPRSAAQYLVLSLYADEAVRDHFDREFALAEALTIDGVASMAKDCVFDHYMRVLPGHRAISKLLSSIDGLLIARSMGEDWHVETISEVWDAALREERPEDVLF